MNHPKIVNRTVLRDIYTTRMLKMINKKPFAAISSFDVYVKLIVQFASFHDFFRNHSMTFVFSKPHYVLQTSEEEFFSRINLVI